MVMMSLLTLMAMFGGVRQNTPKVKKKNYFKKVKKSTLCDQLRPGVPNLFVFTYH
jgi:hypothetical protein